jgi:hypothetical protein
MKPALYILPTHQGLSNGIQEHGKRHCNLRDFGEEAIEQCFSINTNGR